MIKDFTTVKVDVATYEKLRRIAEVNQRSLAGQVRYWVALEMAHLEAPILTSSDTTNPQPATAQDR